MLITFAEANELAALSKKYNSTYGNYVNLVNEAKDLKRTIDELKEKGKFEDAIKLKKELRSTQKKLADMKDDVIEARADMLAEMKIIAARKQKEDEGKTGKKAELTKSEKDAIKADALVKAESEVKNAEQQAEEDEKEIASAKEAKKIESASKNELVQRSKYQSEYLRKLELEDKIRNTKDYDEKKKLRAKLGEVEESLDTIQEKLTELNPDGDLGILEDAAERKFERTHKFDKEDKANADKEEKDAKITDAKKAYKRAYQKYKSATLQMKYEEDSKAKVALREQALNAQNDMSDIEEDFPKENWDKVKERIDSSFKIAEEGADADKASKDSKANKSILTQIKSKLDEIADIEVQIKKNDLKDVNNTEERRALREANRELAKLQEKYTGEENIDDLIKDKNDDVKAQVEEFEKKHYKSKSESSKKTADELERKFNSKLGDIQRAYSMLSQAKLEDDKARQRTLEGKIDDMTSELDDIISDYSDKGGKKDLETLKNKKLNKFISWNSEDYEEFENEHKWDDFGKKMNKRELMDYLDETPMFTVTNKAGEWVTGKWYTSEASAKKALQTLPYNERGDIEELEDMEDKVEAYNSLEKSRRSKAKSSGKKASSSTYRGNYNSGRVTADEEVDEAPVEFED